MRPFQTFKFYRQNSQNMFLIYVAHGSPSPGNIKTQNLPFNVLMQQNIKSETQQYFAFVKQTSN